MSDRVMAVTSSTAVVGVAVVVDGEVAAFEEVMTDRRHAEELTPMIQRSLASAGIQLTDVTRLAVDVGPGRFTGLRVGLATVRTLALALQVPVVGVSSLEILAAGVDTRPVTAVIDARRSEVFQQRFDVVDGNRVTGEPLVGDPIGLSTGIGSADVVVGDGADRYAEVYGDRRVSGRVPSAAVLARLALDREAIAGQLVEPLYLRDPDVQVNIKTRHNT